MPACPGHHVWLPQTCSLDIPLRLSSAGKFSGPSGLGLPWVSCQQLPAYSMAGWAFLGRRISGQEVPAPFLTL